MADTTNTTAASGAASPLTDDQIKAIHHGLCATTGANYLSIARAVEAAHGITAGAPAAQEAEPAASGAASKQTATTYAQLVELLRDVWQNGRGLGSCLTNDIEDALSNAHDGNHATATAVLSLVLDDIDTCIGEAGAGYDFQELSTETLEAIAAYRAAQAAQETEHAVPYGWDCAGTLERMRPYSKDGVQPVPLYAHPPRPQADAGAPTAVKVTQDMRRVFREAYRVGGFWADRLDYALDRMLAAAAPQAPAAGAAPSQHITQPYTVAAIRERVASGDYSAELMLQHALLYLGAGAAPTDAEIDAVWKEGALRKDAEPSIRGQFRWAARAVLARWGAAAPAQEADDGWTPIETAPEGERVLLGPRHAPVVGTVHQPAHWHEEQEPTATVVHYNGTTLVAGYRCSEWHRLPGAARARQEGQA